MPETNTHHVRKNQIMLSERDLAERWGMSRRTLQRWRAEGRGPTWLSFDGTVRYRIRDILAYEDRREHGDETA